MTEEKKVIKCGIVMPISEIDGYSMEHWCDVKEIIEEAVKSISEYSVETSLVSDADDVGIIHKRIINNIYNSDVVICDVSGKNPNVMFELGLRMAFDKAVVIIKDEYTDYSFDTGIIEHLQYPRDLRYSKINNFKVLLRDKFLSTYKKSVDGSDGGSFLKNFGEFKVAKIDVKEVSSSDMVLDSINELKRDVNSLRRQYRKTDNLRSASYPIELEKKAESHIKMLMSKYKISTLGELMNFCDLYSELVNNIKPDRYYSEEKDFKMFYDDFLRNRLL